jgi:hypothetical protein
MLKAQLHVHCKEDPQDNIDYSAKEVIDEAARNNFDVLSFTCHDKVIHTKELEEYAKRKKILLIPGIERTIEGKHVLIYNITSKEIENIKTFQDLKKLKNKLIIAPHPFHYLPACLKDKIIKYDVFDAWEFSFFYTKLFNPNKKILKLAKKYNKPIVGTSDVHFIEDLNQTFTLIDADKNINSIFNAIKSNKIKVISSPLKLKIFLKRSLQALLC